MTSLAFINHDPQDAGPQYLEDLATGYWFSEVLFHAVELKIFTFLEPDGKPPEEIAAKFNLSADGLKRFLQALCAMGLINCQGSRCCNTKMSSKYLVLHSRYYQGDSILWRKQLTASWQGLSKCLQKGGRVDFGSDQPDQRRDRIQKYIKAMDRVARTKVEEILAIFEGLTMEGEILDVGAGSGAVAAGFLEKFTAMKATLMDLPEVLEYTRELMASRQWGGRIGYCEANVLEIWPVDKESYYLVILSNIIHAYSEAEAAVLLNRATECLKPGGLLLIHDFFLEHYPLKAALFDLNMFINTYNGKVFSSKWVMKELDGLKLYATGLIPLATDTAVILAAKDRKILTRLSLDR